MRVRRGTAYVQVPRHEGARGGSVRGSYPQRRVVLRARGQVPTHRILGRLSGRVKTWPVSRETVTSATVMRRQRRTRAEQNQGPLPPVACERCSRPTTAPRAGLCPGCAVRKCRGHLPEGPCGVCGMSDVRVLVRHRLGTLCANHAAVAGRREMAIEELRRECSPSFLIEAS